MKDNSNIGLIAVSIFVVVLALTRIYSLSQNEYLNYKLQDNHTSAKQNKESQYYKKKFKSQKNENDFILNEIEPGTINPYGSLSVSEAAKLRGTSEEVVLRGYEHEEELKRLEQENIRRSQLTPAERSMEDFNEAYKQGARIETEKLLRANPKYNQR